MNISKIIYITEFIIIAVSLFVIVFALISAYVVFYNIGETPSLCEAGIELNIRDFVSGMLLLQSKMMILGICLGYIWFDSMPKLKQKIRGASIQFEARFEEQEKNK